MVELKTKVNDASVEKFINSVKDEEVRKDCFTLLELMKKTMKEEPKMWGSSIVGFGTFHYKGKSGREGDWYVTGFSPRKQNMTVYFCLGFKHLEPVMKKLGKFKISAGSCLYFNKLSDIDTKVLKEMLAATKKELPNLVKIFNTPR
jgi:nucleoid DNA-binding protein